MARRGFPFKKALGLSKAQENLSKKIGIPLSEGGRRQKFRRMFGCGGMVFLFLLIFFASMQVAAVEVIEVAWAPIEKSIQIDPPTGMERWAFGPCQDQGHYITEEPEERPDQITIRKAQRWIVDKPGKLRAFQLEVDHNDPAYDRSAFEREWQKRTKNILNAEDQAAAQEALKEAWAASLERKGATQNSAVKIGSRFKFFASSKKGGWLMLRCLFIDPDDPGRTGARILNAEEKAALKAAEQTLKEEEKKDQEKKDKAEAERKAAAEENRLSEEKAQKKAALEKAIAVKAAPLYHLANGTQIRALRVQEIAEAGVVRLWDEAGEQHTVLKSDIILIDKP